ncbi:zinc finger, CCHC-type containing protein [Tanacetum coccineum]
MDESILVSSVIDKLPPSWKDLKHSLKHGKDDLSLVQLGSHLRIEESLRAQENDKGRGKEVVGSSMNMIEEGGKNKNNKQNKGKKCGFKDNGGSGSNKKPKFACWKCGKTGHFKKDCRSGNKKDNKSTSGSGKRSKDQFQDQGYNLVHVWNRFIKYYVSLISEAFYVQVDAIAWWIDYGATTHVCKDRCWFKTYEPAEDGSVLYMGDDHFALIHRKGSVVLESSSGKSFTLFNVLYVPKLRKNLISGPVLNKCGYKQVYESDKYILSKSGVFVGFGYYSNGMFVLNLNKVPNDFGIIHETTAPYTPQQNGVDERKNRDLKEMVNSMLSYSGLSEGFWGEAMAVVRLSDPKRKTLGEKGIDCIFVGYAEHFKAYRFYVIVPNDCVSINTDIELRDEIFDENHFSSIPRLKDIIQNLDESQKDNHSNDVLSETPEPRKAMQSRDVAFWKDAIDDEIGLTMENNTRVLSDLPPGCKPLGCKWIFKRKIKVDRTVDKFKARLVFKGFRQKKGIDYFDTYAPVARITTIRLLLALAAIHNLVIHQMDVKIAFLNGDLEEEVYMKQPKGFIMLDNEHKYSHGSDRKLMPTGKPVDQLKYSRAISCLMYAMMSTRPDIAYVVVDGCSCLGEVPFLGFQEAKCITTSTMESEFVASAAAGKESEWLRNLIHEIPIWPKPIAPISIHCDSAATLAKSYSQIYNGKSRHLGVRHSMIRELIMNGVISIEFVRSQHNLDDHLTKGLTRDLVIKSVIGMKLKSI